MTDGIILSRNKDVSGGSPAFYFGYINSKVTVGFKTSSYSSGTILYGLHHLAAVIEPTPSNQSTVTVYRNRTMLWQTTIPEVMDYTLGKPWVIGQQWGANNVIANGWNGIIDEVRIWQIARAANDIQDDMYPLSINKSSSGLFGYYPFDLGYGGLDYDELRNQAAILGNGVQANSPTWVSLQVETGTVYQNQYTPVFLPAHDFDGSGDTLYVTIESLPSRGKLYDSNDGITVLGSGISQQDLPFEVDNDQHFVMFYAALTDETGSTSFTYAVTDGRLQSDNNATIQIQIQPPHPSGTGSGSNGQSTSSQTGTGSPTGRTGISSATATQGNTSNGNSGATGTQGNSSGGNTNGGSTNSGESTEGTSGDATILLSSPLGLLLLSVVLSCIGI